jgi:glycosyltransferase involved in cell wall biosynthesis
MTVVFFDPRCPQPYARRTLRESGLGGTEATTIRIAEVLDALVIQHNRTEADGRYRPPGAYTGVEHVVVLRDPRPIAQLRNAFPRARLYLWVHDLMKPGRKKSRLLVENANLLCDSDVTIVCVSHYQRKNVDAILEGIPHRERICTRTIYNPVDDELVPDGSPIDRSKLIFFSSPNRGLDFTLDVFQALRRRMPELRLQVANPGYKQTRPVPIDGVEWLGSLPHSRVLTAVRTSLCTLVPNFVCPESFGLVYAESKAVGTPVLTHGIGAAEEVLADATQVMPVTNAHRLYARLALLHRGRDVLRRAADRLGLFDAYTERISAWRAGERPRTGPDQRFSLTTVAEQWRTMFSA